MSQVDSVILQAAGPILTAIGSIFLAVRLEAIIDTLLEAMDANQKAVLKHMEGDAAQAMVKSHGRVQRGLRKGKKILVWGFSLIALGGMVNALSYFVN